MMSHMTKKRNYKGVFNLIEDRYACAVLDDLREMDKSKNYTNLKNAVEELQSYCTRMEDGLWEARNASETAYNHLNEKKPNVKEAKKAMEKRWKKLKKTK